MTKTVTSLFHSELHAIAAANRLEQVGISRDHIDIWSTRTTWLLSSKTTGCRGPMRMPMPRA